jgi:hypothetical protein
MCAALRQSIVRALSNGAKTGSGLRYLSVPIASKRHFLSVSLTVLGVPHLWILLCINELRCQEIIEWE